MKHKLTASEATAMLEKLNEAPATRREALLEATMFLTEHVIDYPPHWQINYACKRLDRLWKK